MRWFLRRDLPIAGFIAGAMGCAFVSSCLREPYFPPEPPAAGESSIRLILTADVTTGTIPLTVSFTGTLRGVIDTLYTKVPEVSLEGGFNPEEELYTPVPDSVIAARTNYPGREHYFRAGTFGPVMILHGVHGDIASDTVMITVH
jgi:hypothetical protein